MTDIVEITSGNLSDGFQLAMSILNAGASDPGWIVEAAGVELSVRNSSLSTCDGEFAYNAGSSSGLDFVVDDGEAYVGGTWLARDTQSTVTLPASSTTTVYLGYDAESQDTVIVGQSSDFSTYDKKMPIYDVTTDGSGITGTTDRRTLGATLSRDVLEGTAVGSEFNTLGFTGRSTTPKGALDDTNNEIWRAYGSSSDFVVSVEDGSDYVNLAYNAYYDGTWKFIASGYAHRMSFDVDGVHLQTSTTNGPADSTVTWADMSFERDGDIKVDGVKVYDGTLGEVPQSIMGGPAASLTSYPLPPADIDTGAGSGLDADTVDGLDASELGGGTWTSIGTYTDETASGDLSIDTGTLSTTYDQYYGILYVEYYNTGEGTCGVTMRINNDASSNYETGYTDYSSGVIGSTGANENRWQYLASTFGMKLASAEFILTCPDSHSTDGYNLGNLTKRYPTISSVNQGAPDAKSMREGVFWEDTEGVNRITLGSDFWTPASGDAATGLLQLYGRDFNY